MKLKKLIGIMLSVVLILSMATACGNKSNDKADNADTKEITTEKETDTEKEATTKREDDSKSDDSSKNNPDSDTIELYKEAIEKMKTLDAIDVDMDMDMQMNIGGGKINTTSIYNMQITNQNDLDNMEFAMSSVNETMGQTYEMNLYYKDGYIYSNLLGNNSKAKVNADSATDFLQNTDIMNYDLLKDVKVEKNDNNTIFSFNCDKEGMQEYLDKASMDSLSGVAGNIDYLFNKMEGTVVINEDGYVKSQYLTFDISMNYDSDETEESLSEENTDLDMIISINVEYNNPGEDVTVTFPDDLDSYTEVDSSVIENMEKDGSSEIDEELMTEISEAE